MGLALYEPVPASHILQPLPLPLTLSSPRAQGSVRPDLGFICPGRPKGSTTIFVHVDFQALLQPAGPALVPVRLVHWAAPLQQAQHSPAMRSGDWDNPVPAPPPRLHLGLGPEEGNKDDQ